MKKNHTRCFPICYLIQASTHSLEGFILLPNWIQDNGDKESVTELPRSCLSAANMSNRVFNSHILDQYPTGKWGLAGIAVGRSCVPPHTVFAVVCTGRVRWLRTEVWYYSLGDVNEYHKPQGGNPQQTKVWLTANKFYLGSLE